MVQSIVEAVFRNAERVPDKLCLADDTDRVTYAEYKGRILAMAQVLSDHGIKAGDSVVAEASQTVDYLSLQLAIQLLGAVFVPVERNCAPEKIASFAATAHASFIVTTKEAQMETDCPCTVLSALVAEEKECTGEGSYPFPAADTVCEILFSTGTTGKEKGIVLSHRSSVALAENVAYGVEMEEDNVELIPSPMNHSHGLRRYYANMWKGATVILLGSVMDVRRFFSDLDEFGVNSIDLVPSALSVLLKLSRGKLAEYADQLRYVQLGSAPIMKADKDEARRLLPKTRLYNFFGSTESGCICIYEFNLTADKPNCIGKPTHNAEILIVDDDRNPISSDAEHTGLLASKGSMNMEHYFEDPEETARAYADGIVYSNDIAYIDEDGDVILLGRKGDVINIGGKKVSPDEIENVAKKCPMIKDCACVPAPDPIKGNVPKLFVVPKRGEFDPAAIRDWLAGQMEPFKVPKYIERIDEIPRTFNGKIQRKKLM